MKITTTITAIKDGVCLFETEVVAYIAHNVDRYNELEWHVDQYTVEGIKREWDDMAGTWKHKTIEAAVPENLAVVFDEYLDRAWMEEQIREELAANYYDAADHARDMALDR